MLKYTFLKCFILVILAVKTYSKNSILIFGGNGFIGSECVHLLLMQDYDITLVSRGSNYYDYEMRIKPYVKHISCDRYDGLQNCPQLQQEQGIYDFIIDFSAYYPSVIQDAVQTLKGKFHTYIYISTDSVYEVSIPSDSKKSKETDANRHPLESKQEEANARDDYGHYKLEGEEVLLRESQSEGLQYVILRFPDIIGPRDTTYRWWTYQTWFQFYANSGQPMFLPSFAQSLKTSYVYVKDIANILREIVRGITEGNTNLLNQIFNFAFPMEISLRTLLDTMQQVLNVQGVEYRYSQSSNYFYPSVTRGPIDVGKVQSMLPYKITPWMQAVQETVNFFNESLSRFPSERQKMLQKLSFLVRKDDVSELERKIESYVLSLKQDEKNDLHDEL